MSNKTATRGAGTNPPYPIQTQWLNGNMGTKFGDMICPTGAYVNKFYGRAGNSVDDICVSCSDGTDLGCGTHSGGGAPWTELASLGWTSITGVADGDGTNMFLGHGTNRGGTTNMTCPGDQVVVGLGGWQNSNWKGIENAFLYCGSPMDEYCVDNLESDFCQAANVDAKTLNKACAANLTDTCRNRRQELTTSTINAICAKNPNDPICSCFLPVPSYIDPAMGGNQQCWNSVCASQGYIPNPKYQCPPITICKENIPTTGDSNILTGNVQISTCGSSGAVVNNPAGSTSTNPVSSTVSSVASSPLLLIILFIVIAAAYYYSIMPKSNKLSDYKQSESHWYNF